MLSISEVQTIKKKITKLVFNTNDDFIINDYMKDKEKFIQSFTHYFNYSHFSSIAIADVINNFRI